MSNEIKGKIVSYIRVSTVDQNDDRQHEALKKYNPTKTYQEKISAKDKNRPQLNAMLDYVREGDTVVVHDLSRLARNTKDLLDIVEILNKNDVTLISDKENIDTSTATGKMLLTMIGAINQFERDNLLERQKEGIAIAKKKGMYKGRKAVEIDDNRFKVEYDKYLNREITKTELAKVLRVSRPTLDKMIKDHQENNQ